MPGEHEPQQAVLMAWPERPDNWRLGAPAKAECVAVASAIAEVTPVTMCASASQADSVRHQLSTHIHVIELARKYYWLPSK